MGIPSLRQLVTELETNDNCKKLGLNTFAFSTLKDGFTRFSSKFFEKMYQEVIKSSSWLRIDAIDELGIFRLVDGSIFPTLISMDWAVYKKTKSQQECTFIFEPFLRNDNQIKYDSCLVLFVSNFVKNARHS
jgi:uncharacterized protein with ParB-like and HNH nuclease domain